MQYPKGGYTDFRIFTVDWMPWRQSDLPCQIPAWLRLDGCQARRGRKHPEL